ncbi:MAG: DNA polymerase III subunit gamma/tau [Lachnospiraceae bacterium]
MAYTALYRKWRPSRFEDVRGQEHIVRTLTNQIRADRIGHAYLFCGTRGTGKTTVAKIFARAVNCEHPVNGSPCNECAACKAIAAGSSMNVVEIDAASNNGVDNIREIRDEVQYSPTEGKYRVYIIDEVHMLSPGAFNALLKTLEEPPSYVIFILATTEVHKIPITVLSRCQRYDFKRISNEIIADQIAHLLREEHVEAEYRAIQYVAKTADGSMRDALSLLEQCISFYYGQELTYEKVLDVLGAVDTGVFSRLLREIIRQDVAACVALLDEIVAGGRDLGQFVTDFTWYMRNLLLVQTADHAEDALDMSADNLEALKEEAKMLDVDTLMRYIRIFSELSSQIRFAVSKRVLIEIALIKLMKPAMETDLEGLHARIRALEDRIARGGLPAGGNGQGQPEAESPASLRGSATGVSAPAPLSDAGFPSDHSEQEEQLVEIGEAEYSDYEQLSREWGKIVASQGKLIGSLLKGTSISYDPAKGLCILFTNPFNHTAMNIQSRMEEFNEALSKQYQKEFKITTKLVSAGEPRTKVVKGTRIPGIEMDIGMEDQ